MAGQPGTGFSIRSNVAVRVTAYYAALLGIAALIWNTPGGRAVLHGTLGSLLSGSNVIPGFGRSAEGGVGGLATDGTTLAIEVAAGMIGAVLFSLPVAWVYALTRQKRGYQQSVVHTLMILPPLVAGVVAMVKYSLALAFGLAGIVAAVRFRNTLEDSKDAVYIFLATAIGLASAVQLTAAFVISAIFNMIAYALWYTDFGKSAAFEGARAKRRLEETRARLRQTGSFVAMLDQNIFENMSPEQLELAADRALRRRRRLETDAPDENEMQNREVLLRVRTRTPEDSRATVEPLFDEFFKKWRYGGVVHERDGTHFVEYAVQLKKSARSSDLVDALNAKPQVLGVEIK